MIKEHNLDTNVEFQKAKLDGATSPWRGMLKAIGLASDDSKRSKKRPTPPHRRIPASSLPTRSLKQYVWLRTWRLVQENLSVEPVRDSRVTVKDTRLIDVVYTNTDPELAAFVANSIGETFTSLNDEKRKGTSTKTSDFLQNRINDLQAEIRNAELKLVDLKEEFRILPTTGEQTIVLERLGGLNKDLLTAENDRKNAQAEYDAVKNEPDKIHSLVESESARYISERKNYVINFRNETAKTIAGLNANKAKMLEEFKEELRKYARSTRKLPVSKILFKSW